MPVLKIKTNQSVDAGQCKTLLSQASSLTATTLGKPESYVMVSLEHNVDMLFAGSDAPLAYLELKSLGLPEEKTADLSAALCGFITESLGIDSNRIYIEFASPERQMFGWDGHTF